MNNPGAAIVRRDIMALRFLLFLSLATAHSAAADPAWKNQLTAPAPGDYPLVPASKLDLNVSWKGLLNAGKLRLEFAPPNADKPGTYVVRSSASSLGPAAVLFPYQSTSWSELDPSSLRPRLFHAVETDRKETATSTTRYLADRVEFRESTKTLTDGNTHLTEREFKLVPVFDIFSAMLHVRSQNLAVGDQITLVVHPFGTPYLLRVKVLEREVHLNRKTIRLSVGMRKIDRRSLELRPYKKMKNDATLWLSDDADRIPVEFRAAVFIGDIRATLADYKKL
jgi:hypothetical protein